MIGLEVHCELATASKLFCGCRNEFGDEPNTNICPVCLGPARLAAGAQPHGRRVRAAHRRGAALHGASRSIFPRKNYFYPDMPKDYQISQYDEPINVDGWLELPTASASASTRAHIEEDTGKTHARRRRRPHPRRRPLARRLQPRRRAAGRDRERARHPHRRAGPAPTSSELRAILVATGVSDVKMEEGSLRVDANVSVRPLGQRRARHPLRDQEPELAALARPGHRVRGRAADRRCSRPASRSCRRRATGTRTRAARSPARSKEEAYDYRYFPEPDLVPVAPDDEWLADGAARRCPCCRPSAAPRLADAAGVAPADVAAGRRARPRRARARRPCTAVPTPASRAQPGRQRAGGRPRRRRATLDPAAFAALLTMEAAGQLTATQAKRCWPSCSSDGGDPAAIARPSAASRRMDTGALEQVVDEVIAAHPDEWERFKARRRQAHGLLRGQVMDATGKKADGKAVSALLRERAGGEQEQVALIPVRNRPFV